MQIKPIHKFSSDPSLYSLNDPFHKIQIPEENVLLQELFGPDVSQGEKMVDPQKECAVDGNQLQALHTGLPAGQSLRVRLPQPIHKRLKAKERPFRDTE